jgi:hypothetical protein
MRSLVALNAAVGFERRILGKILQGVDARPASGYYRCMAINQSKETQ